MKPCLVLQGRVTWDELFKKGKAIPPTHKGKSKPLINPTEVWFLT
jgi:hypothetical protein